MIHIAIEEAKGRVRHEYWCDLQDRYPYYVCYVYKEESMSENNSYQKELNDVRHDLLNRPDQYITFRDLVERFDKIDAEFNHSLWNLPQIYSNFDILKGKESE